MPDSTSIYASHYKTHHKNESLIAVQLPLIHFSTTTASSLFICKLLIFSTTGIFFHIISGLPHGLTKYIFKNW